MVGSTVGVSVGSNVGVAKGVPVNTGVPVAAGAAGRQDVNRMIVSTTSKHDLISSSKKMTFFDYGER
jgi:tetrahydrodipicolinate N-succinyltransferase